MNALLVSDDNSDGGPSGAAFYATASYGAVPESPTWAMMLAGFAGLAADCRRLSRKARRATGN
jgi:hypothetical protein